MLVGGCRALAGGGDRMIVIPLNHQLGNRRIAGRPLQVQDGARKRSEGVVTLDRLAAMGRPFGDSSLERQLPLEALLGHRFYARPGSVLAEVSAGHFFMPKEAWIFLRRPLASPPGSSSPTSLGGPHLSLTPPPV